MQNKLYVIALIILCINYDIHMIYPKEANSEQSDKLIKQLAQIAATTRRKKQSNDGEDAKTNTQKQERRKKPKKDKTPPAEEFPQPEQPTAASRYNETIEFIYNDAYNTAYDLALLRVNSTFGKKIYLFAKEEIAKTNLALAIKNEDLSQTEFYSYYNTIFNKCMDKFCSLCAGSAQIYTAGFIDLKLIIAEITIHHAVYKAFLDVLFSTRIDEL